MIGIFHLLFLVGWVSNTVQAPCQVKMLMAAEHWAKPYWEDAYPAAFGAENVEFFYARGDFYSPENDEWVEAGAQTEMQIIAHWEDLVADNPDVDYCFAVQRSCTWMSFCNGTAMDEEWLTFIGKGHKTAFSMVAPNMVATTNTTGRLANEDTCVDDADFVDAHGSTCTDWVDVDCNVTTHGNDTYTAQELTYVQNNCTKTCGTCTRIQALTLMVDNYSGSMEMARLFCQQPHPANKRKYITYGNPSGECALRLQGFIDGVDTHCPEKAELEKEVVVNGWSSAVAQEVANEVWAIYPEVSAVMGCWDGVAIAFIESAKEKRVGGLTDLYIMGVDNATAAWPYLESGELFATFDQQFYYHDRGIIAQMKKFFDTDFNYDVSGLKFNEQTMTPVAVQTRDMADYVYSEIFATYDSSVPDLSNNGELVIDIDLDGYVLDVEILTQEFHLVMNVDITWKDTRLMWDHHRYRGVLFPDMDDMFIPNIDFELRSEQYFKLLDVPIVELHHDGTVKMQIKEFNGFYCLFDISDFPFDVHECTMEATSSSTGARVNHRSATSNTFARDFYYDIAVQPNGTGWDVSIVHDPIPLHISVAIPSWFLTIITFILYYIDEPSVDRGGIPMVAILSTLQLVLLYRSQTEGKSCWLMTFNSFCMIYQVLVCLSLLASYTNFRWIYSRLAIIPSYFIISIVFWRQTSKTKSYGMRGAEMTFLVLANVAMIALWLLVEYLYASDTFVQRAQRIDGSKTDVTANSHPFSSSRDVTQDVEPEVTS